MPRKYNKTRRPYRKRYRRRRKNKKGTVNYKKLMDKSINTALERRMVQISQQQKNTLISRKWLTTAPNSLRNSPPILGQDGENFSWHPYTDIVSRPFYNEYIDVIKAADINLTLNNPDGQNPDNAGVNRGMITEQLHGFRTGNSVKIKGISLDIRIISDFGLEALANADNNTALEIIARNFAITRGRIILNYKVVLVTVSNTNQTFPSGDEIAILALRFNNWAYSGKLDVEEKESQRTYKYRTLMSGRINCSPALSFSKIGHDVMQAPTQTDKDPTVNIIPFFREIKQYKAFNPPIQIDYAATDQQGKEKTKQSIYFVANSNYDASSANNPAEQSAAPRIAVISKTYYYDE